MAPLQELTPLQRRRFTPVQADLHEKLLAHIYDEEHSDLPIKTYRLNTTYQPKMDEHVTIESRTDLGAVLAFATWKLEQISQCEDQPWECYEDFFWECYKEYNSDDVSEYKLENLIKGIVSQLVSPLGQDDSTYLIEIITPITIRPFNQTLIKGAQ